MMLLVLPGTFCSIMVNFHFLSYWLSVISYQSQLFGSIWLEIFFYSIWNDCISTMATFQLMLVLVLKMLSMVDVWLCYNWWWITSDTILSTFTTLMPLQPTTRYTSILHWLIALIPYHTILQWVMLIEIQWWTFDLTSLERNQC